MIHDRLIAGPSYGNVWVTFAAHLFCRHRNPETVSVSDSPFRFGAVALKGVKKVLKINVYYTLCCFVIGGINEYGSNSPIEEAAHAKNLGDALCFGNIGIFIFGSIWAYLYNPQNSEDDSIS